MSYLLVGLAAVLAAKLFNDRGFNDGYKQGRKDNNQKED